MKKNSKIIGLIVALKKGIIIMNGRMRKLIELFTVGGAAFAAIMLLWTRPVLAAPTLIEGTGVTWEVVNGTLYFKYSGAGESIIPDYDADPYSRPWHSLGDSINKVVIGTNITEVGQDACRELKTTDIVFESPSSVYRIGCQAFASNKDDVAFSGEVVIPDSVGVLDVSSLGGLQISGRVVLPSGLESVGRVFINSQFVEGSTLVFTGAPNNTVITTVLAAYWNHPNGTVAIEVPEEYLDEYTSIIGNVGISEHLTITSITAINGSPEPSPDNSKHKSKNKSNDSWKYWMLLTSESDEKEEVKTVVNIDRDTYKSDAPSKTVISTDVKGADELLDIKVHHADEKTTANQKLLAQMLVGSNVQILLTENIYPRRDLSTAENGSVETLTWNNDLPKNQPGPVYAVVYNQIDGAYVITGYLDANGVATFSGFKLRPASTITICR